MGKPHQPWGTKDPSWEVEGTRTLGICFCFYKLWGFCCGAQALSDTPTLMQNPTDQGLLWAWPRPKNQLLAFSVCSHELCAFYC